MTQLHAASVAQWCRDQQTSGFKSLLVPSCVVFSLNGPHIHVGFSLGTQPQ